MTDGVATDARPQKRRKITIHSSPYLRCLQTSIGIAAGMRYPQDTPRMRPYPTPFQRSSLSQPPMDSESQSNPISDPAIPNVPRAPRLPNLKVDAFLGEWLSNGYYEKTGPPPGSEILVSNAKEHLRRPPEEIRGAELDATSPQEFEELIWEDKENDIKRITQFEKADLREKAATGRSLPKRSRTISFANEITNGAGQEKRHHRRARTATYCPPVPTYSIAPQDAIPIGFVNHARDACLEIDFEWDSQSAPLAWGDGGQYVEEWSTMHRRFRNGLQQMLSYYEIGAIKAEADYPDAVEEEEEQVLILVTHQAGCNALIRLVTNAPALHDVGTASLTLAVRKQPKSNRKQSTAGSVSPHSRRRTSLDLGLSEEFDMKIIASTEHLRSGSNPLGLNSPRLGKSPAFASRRVVGAESIEGFSIGDPLSWRPNSYSALGRSSSIRSRTGDASPTITPSSGSGLWGTGSRPIRTNSTSTQDGVDPKSSATTVNSTIHEEDENWLPDGTTESPVIGTTTASQTWQPPIFDRLPVRRASQQVGGSTGLWGSDSQPDSNSGGLWATSRSSFNAGSINRAKSPGKRRWTASIEIP